MTDDNAIDAQVRVGYAAHGADCRLVAVRGPKGHCFHLTNLPNAVGPRRVADLYRVRWEIESDNKLDRSCLRLDGIGARTGPAVRALVYASLMGSMIIGLLVHHQRRRERPPPRRGTEHTSAPIHPQSLARAIGSAASSFAQAMELKGDAARERWSQLPNYLAHLGKDANWRRRPSVLDQLRGWRITPGQPRKVRAASIVGAGFEDALKKSMDGLLQSRQAQSAVFACLPFHALTRSKWRCIPAPHGDSELLQSLLN